MAEQKSRYWAYVMYPESLPEDWIEILRMQYLPCAISPLHNRDSNPDNTKKKDHYHVILCWPGPTTQRKANQIAQLLGQPQPIALSSVRGYYRYLTHEDNPEKAHYDDHEIKHLNGFTPMDYYSPTSSEVLGLARACIAMVRSGGFTEYKQLIDYLIFNGLPAELDYALNHTVMLREYIKGNWREAEALRRGSEAGRVSSRGGSEAGDDMQAEDCPAAQPADDME